jgi:Ca2+-binding RTX toxin-like protein
MASIKVYDAIGFGIKASNADIVYEKIGELIIADQYSYKFTQQDASTYVLKFSLNYGEFNTTTVIKAVDISNYLIESMDLFNSNLNPLIKIHDLNFKFNIKTGSFDQITFSNILSGNDVIEGNKYNDIIKAEKGNDTLIGNGGNDLLDGGAGADTVLGGSGNDTLIGGCGKDKLTGGTGNDIFDFNALTDTGITSATRDVITDFTTGDKVDLSTLDANPATATNNAFTFIGASAFGSDATGQLRYVYNSVSKIGVLYGSTDADSAAEFTIELTGAPSLSAQSFIL